MLKPTLACAAMAEVQMDFWHPALGNTLKIQPPKAWAQQLMHTLPERLCFKLCTRRKIRE